MRDSTGKFVPGTSGNPRGRPKGTITEALRKLVTPDEVAQFLADTMRNPAGKMPERMAAAFQIFDRFEGRTVSRAEIQAEVRQVDPYDELSDAEIDALEAHETAVLRASASDLLLAGELDVEAAEAEIVSDQLEKEARSPLPARASADSRHTAPARGPVKPVESGPAEIGIADMARRAERRRGRSTP